MCGLGRRWTCGCYGAWLAALREAIGPDHKIRVDANQAWNLPQAVRLLNRWDASPRGFCAVMNDLQPTNDPARSQHYR